MRKAIYSDELPELLLREVGNLVTLIECDTHIKRAASSAVSEALIRKHKPDKDHWAAHLIAMGADEYYGPNRNGDGWPEKMLKRDHPTFVSHGHFFREHKNHDPKFKIGDIKAAAWNDDMKRVELIIHGHKKLAEEEYEAIKAGKELSFSMSARVPYDECSCCLNRATKSAFYCGHLRDHMLQYLPQFKKFAYARNPKGTFFDISKVRNRADRIASFLQYNLGEEELAKAASTMRFIYSDEWADHEGIAVPDVYEMSDPALEHMLTKLASAETYIEAALKGEVPQDARFQFFKEAVCRAFVAEPISSEDMAKLANCTPEQLFDGLASRGALLPFIPFCAYSLGTTLEEAANTPVVKSAQAKLPTLFRDLRNASAWTHKQLFSGITATKRASFGGDPVDQLLDKVSQGTTVMGSPAQQRILRITITHDTVLPPMSYRVKFAGQLSTDEEQKARNLAHLYGMYKVAACLAMEVDQNKNFLVDESTSLLINYQHLI